MNGRWEVRGRTRPKSRRRVCRRVLDEKEKARRAAWRACGLPMRSFVIHTVKLRCWTCGQSGISGIGCVNHLLASATRWYAPSSSFATTTRGSAI
ncbi:hypothetical protein K466DRAFT_8259 [Polyporus arcularius HHB13444]|uniref:Uncharacterized protein n=1 Tax=Polyporus arcularius HHB13444 TaxID=1314778 RepID=A0A5C3PNH6_9APHY|nr:hypothetical protein K466DRAFT_8259 [Polyporus arcularius HHB13444]